MNNNEGQNKLLVNFLLKKKTFVLIPTSRESKKIY